MLLLVFAWLGFVFGKWLGITTKGFVTLGVVSVITAVVQVLHLMITSDRSQMTMLPLVAGTLVVAGMFVGALVRRDDGPSRVT